MPIFLNLLAHRIILHVSPFRVSLITVANVFRHLFLLYGNFRSPPRRRYVCMLFDFSWLVVGPLLHAPEDKQCQSKAFSPSIAPSNSLISLAISCTCCCWNNGCVRPVCMFGNDLSLKLWVPHLIAAALFRQTCPHIDSIFASFSELLGTGCSTFATLII